MKWRRANVPDRRRKETETLIDRQHRLFTPVFRVVSRIARQGSPYDELAKSNLVKSWIAEVAAIMTPPLPSYDRIVILCTGASCPLLLIARCAAQPSA